MQFCLAYLDPKNLFCTLLCIFFHSLHLGFKNILVVIYALKGLGKNWGLS